MELIHLTISKRQSIEKVGDIYDFELYSQIRITEGEFQCNSLVRLNKAVVSFD